jgi:ankyrin repeat protein
LEFVRELLARGAGVETANSNGFTPLHVASYRGHLAVVKELLYGEGHPGANIKAIAFYAGVPKTPLQLAEMNEHADVVQELKRAEAAAQGVNNGRGATGGRRRRYSHTKRQRHTRHNKKTRRH